MTLNFLNGPSVQKRRKYLRHNLSRDEHVGLLAEALGLPPGEYRVALRDTGQPVGTGVIIEGEVADPDYVPGDLVVEGDDQGWPPPEAAD